MRPAALLVVLATGVSPAAMAAIYTCTDADGRTVFRDSPCARGERHAEVTEATVGRQSAPRQKKAAANAGTAPALDRSKVERLVARLDAAMAKRDAKAVVALLAREAVIEIPTDAVGARRPMDRSGYGAYLGRAFSTGAYVYRAAPARTSVSKGKPQASVTRTIRESTWVDGRMAVVEVKERLTVEPQGRGLRILTLRKELQAPGRVSAGRAGGGA
jgi:hypothetical protein